jgi:hypothetical protein
LPKIMQSEIKLMLKQNMKFDTHNA